MRRFDLSPVLFSVLSLSLIVGTPAFAGLCASSDTIQCLGGNRYSAEITWSSSLTSGKGQVFEATTDDVGLFTLDNADQVDVLIRVLDGCAINNQSWVFMVSLADVAVTTLATDLETGNQQTYSLPLGTVHQPISDVTAISCEPPTLTFDEDRTKRGQQDESAGLINGRFRVTVDWDIVGGTTGTAGPMPLTHESAAFWYFAPRQPELLINIEPNVSTGFYRFLSSATSDIAHTIQVFDRCTQDTKIYQRPDGILATFIDEQMHPIDCTNFIFGNDFESGNLSFWSSHTP